MSQKQKAEQKGRQKAAICLEELNLVVENSTLKEGKGEKFRPWYPKMRKEQELVFCIRWTLKYLEESHSRTMLSIFPSKVRMLAQPEEGGGDPVHEANFADDPHPNASILLPPQMDPPGISSSFTSMVPSLLYCKLLISHVFFHQETSYDTGHKLLMTSYAKGERN